jgi:hypothetical protein
MGCHLGWHFPAGCPLRGGRVEYVYTIGTSVPLKTIQEKKDFLCFKLIVEDILHHRCLLSYVNIVIEQ